MSIASGHAPGHVREEFLEAVDAACSFDSDAADQAELHRISGYLWNCTDTLPSAYCSALDLPAGSTYAQAARHCRA
jgi:hypothetical protein